MVLLALVFSNLGITPASAAVTSWVTVGSADFSAGGTLYTSLAIYNGTPYVAYEDWDNSRKATVMKYDGSNWVTVGSAGFSADEADYTSLAFDGSGTPYVAYEDYGNGGSATVMKYDGSNWVTVGSAGFSSSSVNYISLAIYNGTPYVAYTDWDNGGKATVMKYDALAGIGSQSVRQAFQRVRQVTPRWLSMAAAHRMWLMRMGATITTSHRDEI